VAAKRKPLRGYRRASKNRWETPAGREITDYEYRNRLARKAGWKNYYQASKFRKSQQWAVDRFELQLAGELASDLTYRDSIMHDAWETWTKRERGESMLVPGYRGNASDTSFGRYLIALGKIPSDAYWDYSATPTT
jgi:hypothetical protein